MSSPYILILGANGQLGSDLALLCKQHSLAYTGITQDGFNALTDDLEDMILAKVEPVSCIINCIAATNVDSCEENPDLSFNLNAVFAYKLAKLCARREIRLFHISTDYVFDGRRREKYSETDVANPLNIYGLSKYAGDQAIMQYSEKYFIFRVSSLFGKAGASGKGGNFITAMQRLGREREQLAVIANQTTCPTATLEVARAIIHFITSDIEDYGVYNCVSKDCCSWYEFAYQIFKLSGLDTNKLHKADFDTYNFIARRPQHAVLDTTRLAKYYKMPSWQKSLEEYFREDHA